MKCADRKCSPIHGRILFSLAPAAASLLLLMAIWPLFSFPAYAQTETQCIDNGEYALDFNEKDFVTVALKDATAPIQLANFTIEMRVMFDSFDAGPEAKIGFMTWSNDTPPSGGSTKNWRRSLSLGQDQQDRTSWELFICGPYPECQTVATPSGSLEHTGKWYLLASVFDFTRQKVILYQREEPDGDLQKVAEADVALSARQIDPFAYIVDGRHNKSHKGKLDDIRIWNIARTAVQIDQSSNCPLSGDEAGLIGYWRFDEGQGSFISDCSSSNLWQYGQLGTDQAMPMWSGGFNFDSTDSDNDGIADGCDNCPTISNPEQGDRDHDGYGRACDLCPQTPNFDLDGDQIADSCTDSEIIAQTDTRLVGTSVVSTTTFNSPNAYYWLPPGEGSVELLCCSGPCYSNIDVQDPENPGSTITIHPINWDNVVRTNCVYPEPKVVAVVEQEDTPGYGILGGDVVPVSQGATGNAAFNLLLWYAPSELSRITECTTRYFSFREFMGVNYDTGECQADVCPDPSMPQVFIGASNIDTATLKVQGVELDIKPCSTPSCFGLSGSGVVPVAIHSTANFDARTVNPASVRLVVGSDSAVCEPRDWSIGGLPCDPGEHLILHFDKSCLTDIGVSTETKTLSITGSLKDGTAIFGSDEVCIKNE